MKSFLTGFFGIAAGSIGTLAFSYVVGPSHYNMLAIGVGLGAGAVLPYFMVDSSRRSLGAHFAGAVLGGLLVALPLIGGARFPVEDGSHYSSPALN